MSGPRAAFQRWPVARALLARPTATLVTLVGILSLAGAGAMVDRSASETTREALAGLRRSASTHALAVDRVLQGAQDDLVLAARNPVYADLLMSDAADSLDRQRVEAALVFLSSRRPLDELSVIRADGREMARVADGTVVRPEDLADGVAAEDPAYLAAMDGRVGFAARSAPYRSSAAGRWVIGIATPIIRDLRMVGALQVEVPLAALESALRAVPREEGTYAFTVTRGGRMATHPQLERMLASMGPVEDGRPRLPVATRFGGGDWQRMIGEVLGGTVVGGPFADADGSAYFAASPALDDAATVVVVAPAATLLAAVDRARVDILAILGPLTGLVILATFLFSRRLDGANRRLASALAAQARLAAIVESADDVILSVDGDGRVLTANRAAQRWLRLPAGPGAALADHLPPAYRDDVRRRLNAALADEVLQPCEVDMPGAQGAAATLSLSLSPIRDAGAAVVAVSVIGRDVTERKRLEEQLAHQALHDTLTGMPNRALFRDRLGHALDRRGRARLEALDGPGAAVLFIDLDDFKVVNDTLGHRVGDELLVEVARRIAAAIRPGDTAARLGGDEFTVLLEGIETVAEARVVADRVLEGLRQPFRLHGHDVVIGASIGIAMPSGTGGDADELLRSADTALYAAKGAGKGQHATFDTSMHEGAWRRLELEADLRRAITDGQFVVHYQPIVDLSSGTVREFEALVRWEHPVRGLVAPGDFIPIAEETGLIVPLGRLVLEQACRDLAVWRADRSAFRAIGLSVNISPRQLQRADLPATVASALEASGLTPADLRLEVTEGLELDDDGSIERLRLLRAKGVRISIDDFGTGYASLNAFRRLEIDGLKVDRSFIAHLGASREETAVVTAAISLAGALGIDVTAEGVETPEQYRLLHALRCRFGQGYLFGRPVPAASAAVASLTVPLPERVDLDAA